MVDIRGNRRREIVASVPDGHVYAIGPGGRRLWRYDYARGAAKTFASEVVAADLNRDGVPELDLRHLRAVPWLGPADRPLGLREAALRHSPAPPGTDANGVGVPAAPSIGDLNGDGRLEIVVSTFDHGLDVFRIPRSNAKHVPWPTGRGNLRRTG